MAQPFIILADRGRLRMFALEQVTGRQRLRSIADSLMVEPRLKTSEKYSDKAGSWPDSADALGYTSSDEQLGVGLEEDRRLFKYIGQSINALLQEHGVERWKFAAPSEINAAILANVDPALKNRLEENVKRDLVNVDAEDLGAHFQSTSASVNS